MLTISNMNNLFAVPGTINSRKIQSWDCSEKYDPICKYTWPVFWDWTLDIQMETCGSDCHSVISEQLWNWCLKQFALCVSSYFIKLGLRKERNRGTEGELKHSTTHPQDSHTLSPTSCAQVMQKNLQKDWASLLTASFSTSLFSPNLQPHHT